MHAVSKSFFSSYLYLWVILISNLLTTKIIKYSGKIYEIEESISKNINNMVKHLFIYSQNI